MKKNHLNKGNAIVAVILAVALTGGIVYAALNEYRTAHDERVELTLERVAAAERSIVMLQAEQEALGATNKIPDLRALYEDSLATKITAAATSFTLTRGTSNGTALASSTYPFIIDEGTANEEFVIADCTGTSCTNVTRGISFTTGTTSVTALKKPHGRGASVKITDGPILLIHNRLLQGIDTFPNTLYYETLSTSTQSSLTNRKFIPTGDYVDFVGSSGCSNASATVRGCIELATGAEAASSTSAGGTGALLAIPASVATDTPSQSAASASKAVFSDLTGYIKQGWINLTEAFTVAGAWIFNSTATFNGAVTFNSSATFSSGLAAATYSSAFTASTTITGATTPQPVYLATSTGAVSLSDANSEFAKNFIGFAISSATNGQAVNVQTEGVVSGFTGLTAGRSYFVQDAVGTIGVATGTAEIYVGKAISTTKLAIGTRSSPQPLGVSTSCGVSSGSSDCAAPAYANFAIISGSFTTKSGNSQDFSAQLTRTGGSTSYSATFDGPNAGDDGSYSWTWTAPNGDDPGKITVTESSDPNSDGSASATIYWYR